MTASYSSAYVFTVVGDYTTVFVPGRRLKAYCGVDGYKYVTILSSSYGSPNTTINLETDTSNQLTANLQTVSWAVVKPGLTGNKATIWQNQNHVAQLTSSSYQVKRASSVATDPVTHQRYRQRGSLSSPSNISTLDNIATDELYGRAGGADTIVEQTKVTAHVVSGSNILGKWETKTNNASGQVVTERKFGDGMYDYPLQSRAVVRGSAAVAIGSTETQVTFNVEEYDTLNEFASNTFTVKAGRSGYYHLVGQITLASSAGTGVVLLYIKKGSTIIATSYVIKVANAVRPYSLNVEAYILGASSDTFRLYALQKTGAATRNTLADKTGTFLLVEKCG